MPVADTDVIVTIMKDMHGDTENNNGPVIGFETAEERGGGYSDIDDMCDRPVKLAARNAVTMAHGANHTLVWIDSAMKETDGATKYLFSAYCRQATTNMQKKCDYAVKFIPWERHTHHYDLIAFSCEDANGLVLDEQCPGVIFDIFD